ncbi:mediator of RNA polymerase II transcription subunit 12-like isoform X1 [Cucumis melo var. makuwa]|uniref:Mediator of RNA polymerase II transcription subunit 12-like isoform X1 n=1 Tax=Cucumis melo var. makuwa TaxID=1194695 RepID=A0A5D3C2V9_CUCMM|nr:mediator of RNA polymerase II transcription subunit 12-like isoform X1 [Cucumis melo var. makuwa]TYK05644.1 mediator of RNA polymerase II transcription subunit 12-like isoform X1 [Cucumis melo var. makuwa]
MAIGVSIQQFDMDVTQEYIHWYNNITRLYITRLGAVRSNNARLRDVADDPQQVLDICNNNLRYMEEIHNMYNVSIVPLPVHRARVRVEEAELDEVYHNVEEVPHTTQTQSQTSYGSLMTMMPTFGVGFVILRSVEDIMMQSIHRLHTWMSVHQLLTCMDTDVAMGNIMNICIMKHLQMYQIDKSTNKNQRTKRTENNIELRVDVNNQLEIDDVRVVEHIDFLLSDFLLSIK